MPSTLEPGPTSLQRFDQKRVDCAGNVKIEVGDRGQSTMRGCWSWIEFIEFVQKLADRDVNGYVTFVAPRVSGQVTRVLVDDDNRVKKGDVLVELDPKSCQVEVAIKQAAVDTAKANLVLAQANVRGLIGQARSNRFKLARAIEDVDKERWRRRWKTFTRRA